MSIFVDAKGREVDPTDFLNPDGTRKKAVVDRVAQAARFDEMNQDRANEVLSPEAPETKGSEPQEPRVYGQNYDPADRAEETLQGSVVKK